MVSKAIAKYLRVSARKARLITRPLRGMTVAEAYAFLLNVNKRASGIVYQVLKSAFDNARKKNPAYKETDLYISMISADGGPMLKRFRAASMGRASLIKKRMAHIIIHLDEKAATKKEKDKEKPAVKKLSIFSKARREKKKEKKAFAKDKPADLEQAHRKSAGKRK